MLELCIKYWPLFCYSFVLSSCAPSYQSLQQQHEEVNYYTSAHPTHDISEQLTQIQQSVKRISATAIYQTYYFDGITLRKEQLKHVNIEKLASRFITHNRSTAGTAFIIARNNENVALLSCAHVVSFPDTVINYVADGTVTERSVISTISIKKHQANLIYDLPHFSNFEIVAINERDDLTLLAVDLSEHESFYAPPLPVQIGNPKNLRLGSYILVMGFPKGFPMVTGGIVSDPNRTVDGGFITDALFNRGISGGLILATRNNYNSFEWVGMSNSASATREMQLVPNPLTVDTYQPFEPYEDTIFVQPKTYLTYGITQAIPVTKVVQFLKEHEKKLTQMGININRILPSRKD